MEVFYLKYPQMDFIIQRKNNDMVVITIGALKVYENHFLRMEAKKIYKSHIS